MGLINDDVLGLANAIAVPNLAFGHAAYFTLPVPANASNLKFQISGGTGDADLYVKFGAVPTLASYDCRPYLTGNNETCTFTPSANTTYYVNVRAYAGYSGVTLKGTSN